MSSDLQDRSTPDPSGIPDSLSVEGVGQTKDDEPHARERATIGQRISQTLLGIVVLGSFGVWGYSYSGRADRPTPDVLDDPSFAIAAEPICLASAAEYDALPTALQSRDNIERAAQIRLTNEVFTRMVDDLEAQSTGTDRDRQMIASWIADWRTLIRNRADYADRFELDEGARFFVASVGGERLDDRVPRFATDNSIASCSPPNDIG